MFFFFTIFAIIGIITLPMATLAVSSVIICIAVSTRSKITKGGKVLRPAKECPIMSDSWVSMLARAMANPPPRTISRLQCILSCIMGQPMRPGEPLVGLFAGSLLKDRRKLKFAGRTNAIIEKAIDAAESCTFLKIKTIFCLQFYQNFISTIFLGLHI